jgi:hypothetical protein
VRFFDPEKEQNFSAARRCRHEAEFRPENQPDFDAHFGRGEDVIGDRPDSSRS